MKFFLFVILMYTTQSWALVPNEGVLLANQNSVCPVRLQINVPSLNLEWGEERDKLEVFDPYLSYPAKLSMWTCGSQEAGRFERICDFYEPGYLVGRKVDLILKEDLPNQAYSSFIFRIIHHQHPDDPEPGIPTVECNYSLKKSIPVPKKVFCVPADLECNEYIKVKVDYAVKQKMARYLLENIIPKSSQCVCDDTAECVEYFLKAAQGIQVLKTTKYTKLEFHGYDYLCRGQINLDNSITKASCSYWNESRNPRINGLCLRP